MSLKMSLTEFFREYVRSDWSPDELTEMAEMGMGYGGDEGFYSMDYPEYRVVPIEGPLTCDSPIQIVCGYTDLPDSEFPKGRICFDVTLREYLETLKELVLQRNRPDLAERINKVIQAGGRIKFQKD